MNTWVRLFPFLGIILCSCGKSKDGLGGFLCSIGQAKDALTVGLNLDVLKGYTQQDNEGVDNETVKTVINQTLANVVSSDVLRVQSVESVEDDVTDHIRFLKLGGSFAPGFGVASSLIKKAFSGSSLRSESPFRFLYDTYQVAAAVPSIPKPSVISSWLKSPSIRTWVGYQHFQNQATFHPNQWAFTQTGWQEAIDHLATIREQGTGVSPTTDPVIVAVLDTGVDHDHPDLKDIMWNQGYDATNSSTGTDDENGHGTHCAGIIGSQVKTANQSPLGVASRIDVRIMPIKVLDKDGAGGFQSIEKGLQWILRHANPKPDVLSLSLGAGLEYADLDEETKSLRHELIAEAIAQNMIVIVAAGNEACPLGGECRHRQAIFPRSFSEYTVLPCAYQGVVCVGANNSDETLADYSNYASQKTGVSYRTQVDINAPGTDIYSTWPVEDGAYKTISGTSMATPYVAGFAALLKSIKRDLSQDDFKRILESGQVVPQEIKEKSGKGRLDLEKAMVAFGSDTTIGLNVAPPGTYEEPGPKPVDAPQSETTDGYASTDFWSAICQ